MHICFSTESIFVQHFTMETLTANTATAQPRHGLQTIPAVYFLGKGAEKARSKRDQSEIKHYPKWTRYRTRCERGSTLLQSILTSLHVPSSVYVCVSVFGQVVWFEFVRTSQQLNAAFCNQFLHLCMYHQVCMCVCVSSARLCDLSLSELVSN